MIAYYKDNYKSIEIFPPDQIKTDYQAATEDLIRINELN